MDDLGSPEVALADWLLLLDGGEVVRLELILRLGLALGLSDGGMLARLADLRELIGIVVPPEKDVSIFDVTPYK